jgi:hypothetical protein
MSTTWPLSVWQRYIVAGERARPGSATDPWFVVNAVLAIDGPLDLRALVAAADDLVARHDVLRTRIDLTAGIQVVEDALPASVELLDGWSGAVEDLVHHPVDAATARTPLVLRVARRSAREHLLAVHLHHLCGDAATMWRILRDLGGLYAARCGAPPPDPPTGQYGDYAAHEAELARTHDPEAARWWRSALADDVDFATPPASACDGPFAVRRSVLPAADYGRLAAWARGRRGTAFTGLLALLTEGLAAHVGGDGDRLLFNTLFERRDHPRWRTMAGPCLAPSYVAVPLTATADLPGVTRSLSAAVRHSRYPTWTLDRVTAASANRVPFVPFVELIPQLRPEAIGFGPAVATVATAAGQRDVGKTTFLGIRFRVDVDGSLVAHVRGNGVGWTGRAVRAALDGLPARVRALTGA